MKQDVFLFFLATVCAVVNAGDRNLKDPVKMSKRALVLVAEGSEEIEFVTIVNVLRRAKIDTVAASVTSADPHIEGSRGIKIVPDLTLEEALKKGPYDIVILPGGLKGANTFACDKRVGNLLQEFEKGGKKVAAICAAPTALKAHKVFPQAKIAVYPSFSEEMKGAGYNYINENVVVHGNLITSKGPSTAMEFALRIVESLVGQETAKTVSEQLLLPQN